MFRRTRLEDKHVYTKFYKSKFNKYKCNIIREINDFDTFYNF